MNLDEKWQRLLARSNSTFNGEDTPPFGFITGTLAKIRAENRQQADVERIGWRALLASLAALAVAAAVTVTVNFSQSNDFEPGTKSIVQLENIQVS
jgi:anti-sigma-K factor RskA